MMVPWSKASKMETDVSKSIHLLFSRPEKQLFTQPLRSWWTCQFYQSVMLGRLQRPVGHDTVFLALSLSCSRDGIHPPTPLHFPMLIPRNKHQPQKEITYMKETRGSDAKLSVRNSRM